MLANDKTGDTSPAVWTIGHPIRELDVPKMRLDSLHDIHFGICSNKFDKYVTDTALHALGPRILDIHNRGGRTAEDSWRLLQPNAGIFPAEDEANRTARAQGKKTPTPGFSQFFQEFGSQQKIKPGGHAYPVGAKISGTDVGGQQKYDPTAQVKLCQHIINPGFQYGTRWSKAALEHVLGDAWGMIHFHLDGLESIDDILRKTGNYSHNVTARELRFVYRNWDRFRESVLFYNGYTTGRDVVQVAVPWDQSQSDPSDFHKPLTAEELAAVELKFT